VIWVLMTSLLVKMKRKGQIWIETVIYTLIGLAIIGTLLSIVKPAIDEKKDQILIEKSLEMLKIIEEQIEDVRYYGDGNSRIIETKIKKGKLEINSQEDYVEFSMDSNYKYSEIGENISIGRIIALTKEKDGDYEVSLKLDYKGVLNLSWNNMEKSQLFQPAPTAHKITVTNVGMANDLVHVDFS